MNTSWQDPTLAPEGDASLKPVPVQVEQAERGDGFLCVPGSKLPLFPYNRGWSSTQ